MQKIQVDDFIGQTRFGIICKIVGEIEKMIDGLVARDAVRNQRSRR